MVEPLRTQWNLPCRPASDRAGSNEFGAVRPHRTSPKLCDATYAAFVHGLSSRWTYLSRTIPEVSDLFQSLEDAIHQLFIPSLTGRPPCSKLIRDLLALPVRLGGLGLTNPTDISDDNFQASVKLTAPLVAVIATQDQTLEIDPNDIFVVKTEIRASKPSAQ